MFATSNYTSLQFRVKVAKVLKGKTISVLRIANIVTRHLMTNF